GDDADPATVPGTAPQRERPRLGRRRLRPGPARSGVAGTPWRPVSRRSPGVLGTRTGGAAPTAGGGPGGAVPGPGGHHLPSPDPTDSGGQPVPLRQPGRRRLLRVPAPGTPPVSGSAVRPADGPGGPAGTAGPGHRRPVAAGR